MNIDLDKIEAYARSADGTGDPALLALVRDVRAGDASAKLTLEHRLAVMHLSGDGVLLATHPIRERALAYAEREGVAQSMDRRIREAYVAGAKETTVELGARTRELEEVTTKRDELALQNSALMGEVARALDRIEQSDRSWREADAQCERLAAEKLSLTSQLAATRSMHSGREVEDLRRQLHALLAINAKLEADAAQRIRMSPTTDEIATLRERNAELESDLAKLSAHTNDVSGRLVAMTDVAAKSSTEASAALEREGRTNAALREAYARIEWLIGDAINHDRTPRRVATPIASGMAPDQIADRIRIARKGPTWNGLEHPFAVALVALADLVIDAMVCDERLIRFAWRARNDPSEASYWVSLCKAVEP